METNSTKFIKSHKILLNNTGLNEEFIKQKLLKANSNENIIMLARGESRNFWKQYIASEDFFHWGIKCENGYREAIGKFRLSPEFPENDLKNFLNNYSFYHKDFLLSLLGQIEYSLNYYEDKLHNNLKNNYKSKFYTKFLNQINSICKYISDDSNYDDIFFADEKLFYLKILFCSLLQTFGNSIYKRNSILISTAQGNNRYIITKRYANFRSRRISVSKNELDNPTISIILDYWVDMNDKDSKFFIVKEALEVLKSYEISWFKHKDNEVLILFALFPQQIIGYSYFENGKYKHYRLNPFYIEKWQEDPNFEIGDYIDIYQDISSISNEFPFDTIYTDSGDTTLGTINI